ncbi:MAG: hypothetical protein WDM79_19410 [Terricaulis sp.]
MAVAIVLFANNLIGLGLGTQVVGILSDQMSAQFGDDSLRYALLAAISVASALSAFTFFSATKTLREDLERSRAEQS